MQNHAEFEPRGPAERTTCFPFPPVANQDTHPDEEQNSRTRNKWKKDQLRTPTLTLYAQNHSPNMSQCVSCANQPSGNDSLGGAAHEGAVTPMVVGIIVGTVAVFILVVCALFYCVKLENNKHMAKLGPDGGFGGGGGASASSSSDDGGGGVDNSSSHTAGRRRGGGQEADSGSVKSRPSSATIVPSSSERSGGGCAAAAVASRTSVTAVGTAAVGGGNGGKRRLFAWGQKSGESRLHSIFALPPLYRRKNKQCLA